MSSSALSGDVKRIGVYGGSFDPVHLGHLLVAQAAIEELSLDRLFFVPAAQSPFKQDQPHAPAGERTRMLRLALAGWPHCEVDEQELQRGGVSYTVDTLRDYARRFSDTERFCLIGADNVPNLPKWREAGVLAQLAEFVAIPRPVGSTSLDRPADLSVGATLGFPPPFRGRTLIGFAFGVSSSQIRARVRAGLSIDHLVPSTVAEALRNSRLYL